MTEAYWRPSNRRCKATLRGVKIHIAHEGEKWLTKGLKKFRF